MTDLSAAHLARSMSLLQHGSFREFPSVLPATTLSRCTPSLSALRQAERIAARMITEERMNASVDQARLALAAALRAACILRVYRVSRYLGGTSQVPAVRTAHSAAWQVENVIYFKDTSDANRADSQIESVCLAGKDGHWQSVNLAH